MWTRSPAQFAGVPRRSHYRGGVLGRALTVADLRARGLRRLPRVTAEYLEGGAEEEKTLEGNRAAFDTLTFRPRVLRNVSAIDTTISLFGRAAPLPFAIAPTGFNGLLWHEGDLALARAAAKAAIPFSQSTVSNATIAEVARQGQLSHWFQLYLYGDDSVWRSLLEEAGRQGCEAILLTVDTPVLGNREWDRRNYAGGFTPSLASRLEMLTHPDWMWRVMRPGLPSFPNLAAFVPGDDKSLHAVANCRWPTSAPKATGQP